MMNRLHHSREIADMDEAVGLLSDKGLSHTYIWPVNQCLSRIPSKSHMYVVVTNKLIVGPPVHCYDFHASQRQRSFAP